MPHYNEEGPCDYLWDEEVDLTPEEEYWRRQEEEYERRIDEWLARVSLEDAIREMESIITKSNVQTKPKFIGGVREKD